MIHTDPLSLVLARDTLPKSGYMISHMRQNVSAGKGIPPMAIGR